MNRTVLYTRRIIGSLLLIAAAFALALLTKVLGLKTLEMVVAIAVVAVAIHLVSRISVAIHSARARR